MEREELKKGFISTENKGFSMTFENGLSISVQWGTSNYCEKQHSFEYGIEMKKNTWKSYDAEIAVITKDRKFVGIAEDDCVIGWLSTDRVAKYIEIVSSAKDEEDLISCLTENKVCFKKI